MGKMWGMVLACLLDGNVNGTKSDWNFISVCESKKVNYYMISFGEEVYHIININHLWVERLCVCGVLLFILLFIFLMSILFDDFNF